MRLYLIGFLTLLCFGCINQPQINTNTPFVLHQEKLVIRTRIIVQTDAPNAMKDVRQILEYFNYTEDLAWKANLEFLIDSVETIQKEEFATEADLFFASKQRPDVISVYFLDVHPKWDGLSILPHSQYGAGSIIYGEIPKKIFAHEIYHQLFGLEHSWEDNIDDTNGEKYRTTNVMDYSFTSDEDASITDGQIAYGLYNIYRYHKDKIVQ